MQKHTITRRRVVFVAATIVTAATILTACGRVDSSVDSAASGPAIDNAPATGTLRIWTEGADGSKLPKMFTKFKKDNPDIDIKMTEIPGEQYASKMTAAITAGTVPDLTYIFTEDQPTLIATDGLDPIPKNLVNRKDFFPAIWDNAVADGVAYGIPWYTYANMLIYRVDIAKKAGIDTPPTDWAGLTSFAKKLKANGVEFPLALAVNYDQYSAWQLGVMAAQNGGALISDDLSKWTINDPKNVEALDFWASLIKDGYASADGPGFLDTVSWSAQGKNAAIVNAGPWFASWFDDANGAGWGDAHLAYAQNPAGPGGGKASTTGGGSWFVPRDSKNKDAAWKFARFMSEPSSQIQWYKIFGNMPAVRSVWDAPELNGTPVLDAVHKSLEVGIGRPKVSTWTQVGDIIGKQMEQVVRGGLSAQAALDAAQQQAESIGMGTK